ncbi:MAG: hypothetical protein JWQ40_4611 [Segetibacter sp.]|jgi:uncharacterized membrane protein YcaP (DUF421 family)|nr:hypothetical protein [Segetibacter sp.]
MENEFLTKYFGVNEHITILEIIVRSIIMFLVTFVMIRLTGMRHFRNNSPFDMVITFLIGGVLSRGVVGATPLLPALASSLALILFQKLFYQLSFQSKSIEKKIKGHRVLIYTDGRFLKENMRQADITTLEVFEDLRVKQQTESLEGISEIFVEKTGETSFIKKEKQ